MTTILFNEYPVGRVSSISTSVLSLERNNKDIFQLNRMLRCYRGEPKTYVRFEELAEYKLRLLEFRKSNIEIISAITNGEEQPKGR